MWMFAPGNLLALLSAASGGRERLIYGALQAWGVYLCVLLLQCSAVLHEAVMQEQHVGVYTQECYRPSCQLEFQVRGSAWFRTPYSL